MLNGTRNVRDHHDWRTEWVVARRSFDASIPPCSAIERRRLITRQTVRYGSTQNTGYTHHTPPTIAAPNSTAWTSRIFQSVWRTRASGERNPANCWRKSLNPVRPVASRTNLRRKLAGLIG